MKVLLIDDAELARDILVVMLDEIQSASEVTWRSDFDSGLGALLSGTYDVCLLDYRLGEQSGLDLLREARSRNARTPVIVLTGHGSQEVDFEAMRAGAADYLVKGEFNPETLDRSLRYVLERARAEEALRSSEERYALAMEGSNDGLWDWHVGAEAFHLSARWKAILGFEDGDLPNRRSTWWERVHPDDVSRLQSDFETHLARGESTHLENEHRLLHRDGGWRHVLVRGKAVRDRTGRALRMAGSLTDITTARNRDPLTGLANRVRYLDRVEHAFKRRNREPEYRFALLFIDLDRFKNVNDSLGHEVGDELLIAIARRLEQCVRGVDTVARLGGDEFVVLLEDSREPDGPMRVAERITEALAKPFTLGTRELFTSASVGISHPAPHCTSPGDLLRDADTAMYRAKAEGRSRVAVFDAEMHKRALHLLSTESDLRRALGSDQLEVFYQPLVSLHDRQPMGFEALVRWRHPERGLVSPAEFIPVAEDSSLIVPIDLFVMRAAVAQLKAWRDAFQLPLSMSVNASRRHFARPEYIDEVQHALDVAGVPADALHLEVTESLTMALSPEGQSHLRELHQRGIKLYVDDFGTGYSSLSLLHTYPFKGIKLDRSFTSRLDHDTTTGEVVKAIVAMARALTLDVVAEGVETGHQAAELKSLGCANAQGYLFCKPMTAAHITEWLTKAVARRD